MRKMLVAAGFAAGLICCQTANAVPVAPTAMQEAAAAATSPLQTAQYSEHRTRHGFVKCYRELVFGPYRCHRCDALSWSWLASGCR